MSKYSITFDGIKLEVHDFTEAMRRAYDSIKGFSVSKPRVCVPIATNRTITYFRNVPPEYIFMECEVCGELTPQRYMTNDLAICHGCMDTPEFLEWLRINRPIFYDFEIAE